MLVRVAQAIASSRGAVNCQSFVEDARAAVSAMREPTVEMLEAAAPGLPDWGYLADQWREMIDYALQEEAEANSLLFDSDTEALRFRTGR